MKKVCTNASIAKKRYGSDDELFRLFVLFERYGYENKYELDIEHFTKDPRNICVNNEEMTYYPSDITLSIAALISGKKFYSIERIEEMFSSIFEDADASD